MNKNYLTDLNPSLMALVRKIGHEADSRGISAYLVGGIVRDIILKRKNWDLDIVIVGEAIPFARDLARILKAKGTYYDQFKTATLMFPDRSRLDIASAREESYPHPGSLPFVKTGTLRDDLFRRDFTINAMAISINTPSFGELKDEFDGLKDLGDKLIRVLHDQSFADDPTRLLRAIRFEQRFGFHIEGRTTCLFHLAMEKEFFKTVKPQRYFSEFKNVLEEDKAFLCLRRLEEWHGLQFLWPNFKIDGKVLNQVSRNLQRIAKEERKLTHFDRWLVMFLALVEKIKSAQQEELAARFQLSRVERLGLREGRHRVKLEKELAVPRLQPRKIYQSLKQFSLSAVIYFRCRINQQSVRRAIDHFLYKYSQIELEIDGTDLKKIGYHSGRRLGEALTEVLLSKIDGRVKNKKDELEMAKDFLQPKK